ncbi:Uncharacterised protein [uncultured archaeon]|nr:Uncharacterised protein [uncultured archaeon]
MNALDKFPAPSFRPFQQETIELVEKLFDDGNEVILAQAPTGAGKTMMYFALCLAADSAFYTTPSHLLINQIINDKHLKGKFSVVRGRANYRCLDDCASCIKVYSCEPNTRCDRNISCANGRCQRSTKYACKQECPYKIAKSQAQAAQTCLTTTAYSLSIHTGDCDEAEWKKRELLVIDEGHNIEDWLRNAVSFDVEYVKKEPETFEDAVDMVVAAQDVARKDLHHIAEKAESNELSFDEVKKLTYYQTVIQKIDHMLIDIERENLWVHYFRKEKDVWGKDCNTLELKPVTVERFGHHLFELADKIIISSATLLDPELFVGSIGLKYRQWTKIEVPSTFPPENHQVFFAGVGRMNYENIERVRPEAIKMLDVILEMEDGLRGIVHVPGYNHAEYIRTHMTPDMEYRLVFHESRDRMRAYHQWLEDGREDSVLVAVAMEEGIDLRDDLARFSVLWKAPYADLSDVYVKVRKSYRDGNRWYTDQALTRIIQASGRIIRSEEDWGRTYIIDDSIIELVRRHRSEIPSWFLASWDRAKKIDRKY